MSILPQNDGSVNTDQVAAGLVRSMLNNSYIPNGVTADDCGPWSGIVSEVLRAFDDAGADGARRAFKAAAAHDASLWALVSGDLGQGGRFRLIPASELGNLPRPVWLLRERIQRGGFGVLYGPSGSGKSFVAVDWALVVAQHFAVIYIAGEGVGGYAARVLAWCAHHKQGPGQLHFMTDAVNLMDGAAVAEFIAAVREVSPALIVVDTLARCLIGGDENSARDMGLAVAAVDSIRRETGAAVLLVHHTNKAASGERGSSALRGAADTMIELSSTGDGSVRVSCAKSKDSPEFEPYRLRFVTVQTGRQTEDGAETSCALVPADQVIPSGGVSPLGRQILECLALEVFRNHGAPSRDIESSVNGSRSAMFTTLSALVRGGYIRQAATREPYFITDKGLAVVGIERIPLEDV